MNPISIKPVWLGDIELWPPVVLAPMAGVTDYPFRALCHRFATEAFTRVGGPQPRAPKHTPGLFVSEMITARPLVEGDRKTLELASFGPDEWPRSLQLYGVDPWHVGEAVKRLVGEGRIDHLDMNFGCPVPKITRRGGGSAIPVKPRLLAKIVRAAVTSAGAVPVTIKFRTGIDASLLTYRDAGRIGQEEGCAAVGLHARTAEQFYEDGADWDAIADLVARVNIPVFGNGDIWEAHDATRMMRETGCAGVIIGRGCLGRPWLFAELVELMCGEPASAPPPFAVVATIMREHAQAMVAWYGRESLSPSRGLLSVEQVAMRAFRKHASWYTKGFRGSAALRERLMHVETLAELDALLRSCDGDEPFPEHALRAVRGKRGRQRKVALPAGYLDDLDDDRVPHADAEQLSSGG
ncbi:tRNA dihydrouridine synthase DusB [Enhygromyxa salina]|uniref:Putative tRNA-dihydrouridine synthase n=1 Tax=Enhygromyxa salina TaxID=215803 RepID=A0A2S9YJ43_9BACT|nr:tRNA dihydrouridine synthase DusB [Enhygromyxa salina]PRQ05056.1 putative tRNA-dihydrouridine synthase [Enhygromyxa salina]